MTSITRARYAWLVLATCALLTLLETAHTSLVAQVHGARIDFTRALLGNLPVWAALGVLIPVIGRGAQLMPLYGLRPWRSVGVHLAAGALFPFSHLALASGVRFVLSAGAEGGAGFAGMSSGTFVLDVLLYWLIVGAHTVYALHQRHVRDVADAAALRLAAERLEGNLMDANLQALRWQLNPHFLFNALNSLSVLAEEAHAARVVEVVGRLSALLRTTLEQRDQTTTLEQEAVFVSRYLDFVRVRFEDRLDVEWELAHDCLNARVPAFVLQPLVENAIKHGVDPASDRATLVIGAARAGGKLRMWVTDRGPGLAVRAVEREGLGLRNTRDRLRQLFGDKYELRLEPSARSGVTATVMIPWTLNGSAYSLQEGLQ